MDRHPHYRNHQFIVKISLSFQCSQIFEVNDRVTITQKENIVNQDEAILNIHMKRLHFNVSLYDLRTLLSLLPFVIDHTDETHRQ